MLTIVKASSPPRLSILLDVDGPCCRQMQRWLDLYNEAYDDSLTEEDITHWNISKIVKPECGDDIHHFLRHPDFYALAEPVEGYQEGVQRLRAAGHEITYVTSCPIGTADPKIDWILRHDEGASWHDIITCYKKHKILGDVLIDDGPHNLNDAKMKTVRFVLPLNKDTYAHSHAFSWADMDAAIEEAVQARFKYRVVGKEKLWQIVL